MGITIHFQGQLQDESEYSALIDQATRFAAARNWPILQFSFENKLLSRVRDEEDWDYEGPTKGLAINPHPDCEPVTLEFDRDLIIQDYTKTQFAPAQIHKGIIALLDLIAPHFISLEVEDESEYYETRDEQLLLEQREECRNAIEKCLADDINARGPVHLPNGRIVDLISG